MTTQSPTLDVAKIRADFPILNQQVHGKPLVYLDNAATSQRPREVIQSMVDAYEQSYANVHRGIHWLSDQSTDLFEQAREKTRQFIGAPSAEEIVFTTGTTGAINLVARSWGDTFVTANDEILVTEIEHHSNLVPWHQLAERVGCKIKAVPLDVDGRLDLEHLDQSLTEKTKLFAFSAVSNVLGTVNPVVEMVAAAHAVGAKVLVDAAQAVPHEHVNVQEWGADFVAFSGHKMMGPSGVGVLYGQHEMLTQMPPFLGGGSMIRRVRVDGFEPADPPAKFEAGTPPIVAAIGLGAAIDYIERIGMEAITSHVKMLGEQARAALADLPRVNMLGPQTGDLGGIVSFVVEGVHAHDVADLLDRQGIAIRAGHHCAMPLHKRLGVGASCRASVYLYNSAEEVAQLVEALRPLGDGLRAALKNMGRDAGN